MEENKTIGLTYPIIYDGDCGFCQSTVNIIKGLDWLGKFEFFPFQSKGVLEKYTQVTKEMCEKEIFLIHPNGNFYGGYDAFRIMAIFLPLTFLISWVFFLPGITQVGRIVYKTIAANRHRISLSSNNKCKIDKK